MEKPHVHLSTVGYEKLERIQRALRKRTLRETFDHVVNVVYRLLEDDLETLPRSLELRETLTETRRFLEGLSETADLSESVVSRASLIALQIEEQERTLDA